MTIDDIRQKLFSAKTNSITQSEFEFIYRDTIDFILEKYQLIDAQLTDKTSLKYLLPCAIMDEIIFLPTTPEKTQLELHAADLTHEATPYKTEPKLLHYPEREENDLVSLILGHTTNLAHEQIAERLKYLTIEQKENLTQHYFSQNNNQLLNFFPYTFQLPVDFITLVKLQKLLPGQILLSPAATVNNFHMPSDIVDSGYHGDYIMVMKRCLDTYKRLLPQLSTPAFYIIPLAFMQKVIFTVSINNLIAWDFSFVENLLMLIKKVNPTIYQIAAQTKTL
jgi:hypothetical protein